MRRSIPIFSATLLLIGAAGCGSGQKQASQESSVDSLLASNPTEQTSGNITPQQEYQQQPEAPPATASVVKPASTKPKTTVSKPVNHAATATTPHEDPGVTLAQGTALKVKVGVHVTSETAQPGDTWTGSVQEAVVVGDRVVIPAGSSVTGVVSGAKAAEKGSRAVLVLSVRSVDVNGKSYPVSATADSLIAGSTRARNVGAVAEGAAAGALLGKAIGGGGKGALIGALVGGAAATGAVASSKGYQVEVKEGAEMTFTVNTAVTMR